MVTGFLIILAMFLVLAGTGPLMVYAFHRFVSQRYRIPGLGELAFQMMGRSDDEESSVDVVMKRMRRLIPGFSIKSLNPGSQYIYRIHVILLAPQDYDLIMGTIGLRAFSHDYADAYAAVALKKGWRGSLSDPLEIYVIPELASAPNHPRLSGTRPVSNHQPYMVVPLLPESFSSITPQLIRERPKESAAEPVSVAPAVTLPYGPDLKQRTAGGEGVTRQMPPEEFTGAFEPNPGADSWMRDVATGPSLLQDGRVVICLDGTIRIGRGSDCQVFVRDSTVSRSHALLRESHGVWVLVPEEGKRCYVNGEFVSAVTPLTEGDVLSFAASPERFEFRG